MTPARKMPDMEQYVGRVADRLRTLHDKTGMTIEEFAEKVNALASAKVATSTVYGWLNGSNTPNLKMLPYIAKALNVSKTRNLLPNE